LAVTIRPRDEDDLDVLVGILRDVYEQDGYPHRWPDDPAEWLASASTGGPVEPGTTKSWVAERDGRPVGHVAVARPSDSAAPRWAELLGMPADRLVLVKRLFVSPSARGLGAGGRLLSAAEGAIVAGGHLPVLEVSSSNADAVALYRVHGWTEVANVDREWLAPDECSLVYAKLD
jgi:GNAT superfamily N-acetyltransferase